MWGRHNPPRICVVSLPHAKPCADFWGYTPAHERQFPPSQSLVKGTKNKKQNYTISKVISAAIGPQEVPWENTRGAPNLPMEPGEAAPRK